MEEASILAQWKQYRDWVIQHFLFETNATVQTQRHRHLQCRDDPGKKNLFPANAARGEHSFPAHKLADSLPQDAADHKCAHDCTQTGPA